MNIYQYLLKSSLLTNGKRKKKRKMFKFLIIFVIIFVNVKTAVPEPTGDIFVRIETIENCVSKIIKN